jgi:polyhydroxybutyrate depolymerase
MKTTARLLIALPALFALFAAAWSFIREPTNLTLVSSGRRREYLLHIPASYDRKRPTPLVISMHGAGGWPSQQMRTSRWNRVADDEGFIVVYPSGERIGPRVWHVGPGDGLTRDVRFISDLIDKLRAEYNIDPNRIYVNGLSNGGGMSFVLSCTISGRIAAVGLVAAAQTLPWKWCSHDRPMPMIAFHGTADPIVPYGGGTTWVSPRSFPTVAGWATNWARRNRCAPHATDSAIAPHVIRREFTGCADDASVVLYTIRDGGHSWPGGEPMPEWFVGTTSKEVDASREMWAFFRAHPKR